VVNNKKYTISQSIGQTGVIGTSSMGSYTIRQGFQQPLFVKHSPSKAAEELSAIIYPNPFLELINIAFTDIVEGEITVKVIDMTGRLLLNERHAPVQLLTLPIEKMAAGNYIIQVISGQKATTSSLIKQ